MPKTGKDITGKIVGFLRGNDGKAVIKQEKDAAKFHCSPSALHYSFGKLIGAGIVKTSSPIRQGSHEQIEFILLDEFREGDGWREALKRKSLRSTPVEVSNEACQSEECLRARKVLLGELVDVFERLKVSQKENRDLHITVSDLKKRIAYLEGEIESRGNASRQLRDDVELLESRLRTLKTQTSKQPPPVTAKKLMADSSGVVTLPGEGLPDRS